MLEGIEVRLGVDYLEHKEEYDKIADKIIYTGAIDAYFDYKLERFFGKLETFIPIIERITLQKVLFD